MKQCCVSILVSLEYADWITALCAFGGRVEDSTEVFICDIFLIVFRFSAILARGALCHELLFWVAALVEVVCCVSGEFLRS